MDLAIFILISAFARWGACVIVHYAETETPVFIILFIFKTPCFSLEM